MSEPMAVETARTVLLGIGFRHRIAVPNVESGYARFVELSGADFSEAAFYTAIADLLATGLIRDPVRLPEGALQCHWHFELTPAGIDAARRAVSS